jgi:2-oxoisovalerate dehydrogenase E1 component alpha subunit
LRGDKAVVLTSIGEGSTSQGEWYEAVNWAAVHKLPVIFMIENNVYAISVHSSLQMAVESAARKADGLGLPGVSVDGLDALAVQAEMTQAVARARAGEGPTVVEVRVNRMTPHSSDDDDRSYRPREEVEQMKQDDPLPAFENTLREMKVLTEKDAKVLDERAREQVEQAVADAEAAPYPDVADASHPVYVEDVQHG